MNISSSKIQVFPISFDRPNNPGARIISEANLLNLIRSYVDRDSFVVSNTYNSTQPFEFILHGYYCKINAFEETVNSPFVNLNGNIYAVMIIDVSTPEYPILRGMDNQAQELSAISFVTNPEEITISGSEQKYVLHILSHEGTTYSIPPESKIKFELSSINGNSEIDGGLIE